MALVKAALVSGFTTLFSDPPDNRPACASDWASAVSSWSTGVTPISATVAAAVAALEIELLAAFETWWAASSQDSLSCDPLETAFANFALLVGTGMLAGSQYAAVPPPGLVGFCDLGTAEDFATAANNFATAIDDWMKTGMATKVVAPFDTVNWS